jgi:hypothetical protein
MNSKIESGINTYVGHFDRLIDICESFGASYRPVPQNLLIPSLRMQSDEIKAAITAVDYALPAYITAEGARHAKFSLLPPLATRVQAVAIILDLPESIIVRIKEVVRKIRGQRAHKLPVNPPTEEPTKHISVSQTSFNEQIEHLNLLIALVESQPAYAPEETDLTVASLKILLDDMRQLNADVLVTEPPLTAARQHRNELLYAPKTGMMDTGIAVKEYVKAAFGTSSPQYKEVKPITFRNQKL